MARKFDAQYDLKQFGAGTAVDEAILSFQKKYREGNNFVSMDWITVTFKDDKINVTVSD